MPGATVATSVKRPPACSKVAGNFAEGTARFFEVDLTSLASSAMLAITDSATLAGVFRLANAGEVPVVGDTFVVMSFAQGQAESTFQQIVSQCFDPSIGLEALYDGTGVTLRVTAVPEPSAMLLAALGGIAPVRWRRHATKSAAVPARSQRRS
jgi:PEP-CTERM motif